MMVVMLVRCLSGDMMTVFQLFLWPAVDWADVAPATNSKV